LYLLFAVVCEEIADVKALAVRLAFDECPNFNGFSSDIAVAVKRYRFFDEFFSMLRVYRHALKNPLRLTF
jgi:predicted ester cyclase